MDVGKLCLKLLKANSFGQWMPYQSFHKGSAAAPSNGYPSQKAAQNNENYGFMV